MDAHDHTRVRTIQAQKNDKLVLNISEQCNPKYTQVLVKLQFYIKNRSFAFPSLETVQASDELVLK